LEIEIKMNMDRRTFVKLGSSILPAAGLAPLSLTGLIGSEERDARPVAATAGAEEPADYTLRIGTGLVEVGPQHIISTTTYNGQFPGPLLRFKEGQRTIIDIYNDTDRPEQFHWHGQFIPVDVDGSAEEGTPYIPPHGHRREIFVPKPSGLRFYHTHVIAGSDLSAGQYSGQVGPVYIEPADLSGQREAAVPPDQHGATAGFPLHADREDPLHYDREEFIMLKEFEPYFMGGGDMAMDFLAGKEIPELKAMQDKAEKQTANLPKGYEVGYKVFTINGHQLGHGKPIEVKQGEHILFHIINGSATEIRSLALPGHHFKVIALDGNPVPHPATVPVLWLGTAERISAIVEMNNPGTWIMGDLADDDRGNGMGVVVRYAGHQGKPQWITPRPFTWDYTLFGRHDTAAAEPDETIDILFAKQKAAAGGFNRWTINGEAFDMMNMQPMWHIKEGKRYRLKMRNASDDLHPMHLHRHSFEITRIGGKPTSGIMKDVVMLGGFQEMEVDFIANNPGLTLFHCHMQLHMDFGFMALFDYA
jgi:FtsP/CotA-like multicopper oxidase with cupredoxin domain